MKRIKKFLKGFRRRLGIIKKIFKVKKIVNMETYFPELNRKSKLQRYLDNYKWLFKYCNINNFYNLYGMDIKGKVNMSDYCDYNYFMRTRNSLNKPMKSDFNYIVLLRDKYVFEKYMNSCGIKTASTIAVIKNGEIFDNSLKNRLNAKDLFINKQEYFIKSVDGECAEGVYFVNSYKKYMKIKELLKKGFFIVQTKLIQNNEMNKLNSKSINTIRIVTVKNDSDIKVLSSTCRIGTNKSGNVDNWAAGGISVAITDDGKLAKYGFYKPGYGIKTTIHPDTKVVLENFKIPCYEEVKELVKSAHKALYGLHSIGFDVAITTDGPVLIEANDNWEISLMQTKSGLKKEWDKSLNKGNKK